MLFSQTGWRLLYNGNKISYHDGCLFLFANVLVVTCFYESRKN
jgi:hypothetical protein